jgi:hypothetical protein
MEASQPVKKLDAYLQTLPLQNRDLKSLTTLSVAVPPHFSTWLKEKKKKKRAIFFPPAALIIKSLRRKRKS